MKRTWSRIALQLLLPALLANSSALAQDTATVARGFLQVLFGQMNLSRAYYEYAIPDFVEHNPEIGDGYAAKLSYFAERARQHPDYPPPSAWANVIDHVLVDGNLFAVHRHVFTSPTDPGRVFVDLWRVAGGKIVEHWDVIQAVPAASLNANTMWCGIGSDYAAARALRAAPEAPSCGPPDSKASGAASLGVVEGYAQALGRGDAAYAVMTFNAAAYVQHSPDIADGLEALSVHLASQVAGNAGQRPTNAIVHVVAEGDLVLLHRHVSRPDNLRGYVNMDLFRVRDGLIAEHWDVHQEVPATSVSGHPMW
jgi:predicted SnoaL-like aldol condensation-catalyzing enzyme